MAKIGYARVSTLEQNKDLQINALREAGCEKIFTDDSSGAKTDRKGLSDAIAYIRPGDVFVVWKLDRAGRSVAHLIQILNTLIVQDAEFISLTEKIDTTTAGGKLIFHLMSALAEFERDLIRERTRAGLLAARARGHNGGRPRKIKNGKVALVRSLYNDKNNDINEICQTLGVSRSTLYRYVREGKQA